MFFSIYGCLLVLISSGFSFLEALPWDRNHMVRLSPRRNHYGASAGFKQANIKDHPFMTSVIYESQLFPPVAGAILNKHWVLSTALTGLLPPEAMKIYTGTNYVGRSGQLINVSNIIVHEKFNIIFMSYNIAVLKTEKPIVFNDKAKPVKLGDSVPKAGTNCTVLGYGYLQDRPYVGWDLGVTTMKVKPQKECVNEHGPQKTVFCAEADGVVPSFGDEGDLVMYNNKLIGIYALDEIFLEEHNKDAYTNVPVLKKWIWKTIRENSNEDEMEGIFKDQFFDDQIHDNHIFVSMKNRGKSW